MAKPQKAPARPNRTWTPKTSTPKNRRSGIYAKQHHRIPTVRRQMHGFDMVKRKDKTVRVDRIAGVKEPFVVKTTMREAFERAQVPPMRTRNLPVIKRVLRIMRRKGNQPFNVQGWRVINRRGRKRGKRSR